MFGAYGMPDAVADVIAHDFLVDAIERSADCAPWVTTPMQYRSPSGMRPRRGSGASILLRRSVASFF
jgi:hypothetical protein